VVQTIRMRDAGAVLVGHSYGWGNGHHRRGRQGPFARQGTRLRRRLRAGQRRVGLVAHHAEVSGALHSGRGRRWLELRAGGPPRQAMQAPSDSDLPAGDSADWRLATGATFAAKPSSPRSVGKEVRSSTCTSVCGWTLDGPRIASNAHTIFRGWLPKLLLGFSSSMCEQAQFAGTWSAVVS
jgi:hypothetical protein